MSGLPTSFPSIDTAAARRVAMLVVVATLVATAGCSGVLSGDDGSSETDPVEHVPEGNDLLIHVDLAVLEDDTTQQLIQTGQEQEFDEQELQDGLDEIESETGLDPRGASQILVFGNSENYGTSGIESELQDAQQEDIGIVVVSDWSEEEVVNAIESAENGTELEQTSHQGEDALYLPANPEETEQEFALGVLGDGTFVVGTEDPVRNALDVTYGDASSVSGPSREAYDQARDGYVTVSMEVPEEQTGAGGGMAGPTDAIQAMSAVYYTSGDSVGVEGRLVTDDEQAAQQLTDGLGGILALAAGEDPELQDLADRVEFDQDGTSVVITFESPVDELIELAESS